MSPADQIVVVLGSGFAALLPHAYAQRRTSRNNTTSEIIRGL